MDELCTDDILQLWQKYHGHLDEKWKFRFFDHPAIDQLKTFQQQELDQFLMDDPNLSRVLEKLLAIRASYELTKATLRSINDADWEITQDYSKTPTREIDQNIDDDPRIGAVESSYKTRAWTRDRNQNRNRDWDKDAELDMTESPFETP